MNNDMMTTNRLTLCGKIISSPVFSHEVYGEGFYEMFIEVERLSMQKDILPITVSERLISEAGLGEGVEVSVIGQFRSYNKLENGRSKLMLTVFVREIISLADAQSSNEISLVGYICKPTIYRTTPFSREICDLLLAVNRAYNKSDYIPCIAWGRNARFLRNLKVGERLSVLGRIQSRNYVKKYSEDHSVEKTAYEVSISRVTICNGETDEDKAELRFNSDDMMAENVRSRDKQDSLSDEDALFTENSAVFSLSRNNIGFRLKAVGSSPQFNDLSDKDYFQDN